MKTISDNGTTYEPVYNDYDQRTLSEEVLEFTAACLIPLFILLGCWLGGSLLLLMVPKTMWLLYWPLQVIRFCGKWGTIIGWPLWLILEFYGHMQRAKEKRRENRRLNGEH